MLYLTVGIFALAAFIGVVILKNWLTSAHTSRTVIYAHGFFAAVALVLLLIHVIRDPSTALYSSLLLFALAAVVGFYMFFQDLKKKFSPTWMAITHALIAVAGFIVLLLFLL